MQTSGFGWLVLLAPVALSAAACGDTDHRKKADPAAESGAGGDDTGGTASAGRGNAGSAQGGSKPTGGSASAGTSANGGGGAGAPPVGGAAGSGDGEAGGAGGDGSNEAENCVAPASLPILGNYVEPNGDQLWLRDSGKAVTLTRVTPGTPVANKLPSLWQVVSACAQPASLVLKSATGTFTRLEYIRGASALTVCLANGAVETAEAAATLPAADRTNTIDTGCNAGPWTRAVKGAQ